MRKGRQGGDCGKWNAERGLRKGMQERECEKGMQEGDCEKGIQEGDHKKRDARRGLLELDAGR